MTKDEIKKLPDGKHIHLRKNGTRRVFTVNNMVSKTDQSLRDEVNVNSIMLKYHQTGNITHIAKVKGTYGDVSEVPDLKEALEQVKVADEAFMGLPSKIRARFNHSATNMLDFLRDSSNDEEAIKLGLKSSPEALLKKNEVEKEILIKKEEPIPKPPDTAPKKTSD